MSFALEHFTTVICEVGENVDIEIFTCTFACVDSCFGLLITWGAISVSSSLFTKFEFSGGVNIELNLQCLQYDVICISDVMIPLHIL